MESSRRRGEAYFANHSLGRMPDAVRANVARALDAWADPERAWRVWAEENDKFRGLVAQLIGVSDPKQVVPKSSAGQGLRAVLNSFPADRPVRVVATTEEFDSLDFVLRRYTELGRAEVGWVGPARSESGVPLIDPAALAEAAQGADLLVFSHVYFATGQVVPNVPELVEAAHSAGALVLCDTYHSFCALDVRFDAWGLDFAVGGCYKYARGGAGACWLAVAERHTGRRTADTGWFAKHDPMAFERGSARAAEGGDSWLESTPPVLAAFQATPGLEVAQSLGTGSLRAHSLEVQSRWRSMLDERGVGCFHPARPEEFGAFSLVPDDDAARLCAMLAERGVVADARGRFARFCPDVLTTDADVEQAVAALAALRA
jgi:kynureninase